MHGDVRPVLFQSHFEFPDEQALTADGGQASILNAVALSHHGYELNLESRMCPAQQPRDMLGLPERQLALASRDPQRLAQGILHAGSLLAGNSADFKR